MQILYQDHSFLGKLKTDQSSSPGESHPQALTEPDVRLSPHPAPAVQSSVKNITTLPYP